MPSRRNLAKLINLIEAMTTGSGILIVDDDLYLRRNLALALEVEGYVVRTARNGEEGLRKFCESRPALTILDIDMPKMNGFSLLAEIRRLDPDASVVMLTALDSDADKIRGLGLGVNAFVSKTESDAVRLAVFRNVIDRKGEDRPRVDELRLGRVIVNMSDFEVRDGSSVTGRLTRAEGAILRAFASRPRTLLTPADLASAIGGPGYNLDVTTLRSHVSHLRRKLGNSGAMIRTERDDGYRLLI